MTQTSDFTGKRWHDMGGQDAGPVLPAEHDFALWEKRVDALMVLCTTKGHFTVDGLRRAIEDMGETAFETMSYYERWVAAVNQNMIEGGVYTLAELGAKMDAVKKRGTTYGEAATTDG
ncbi:ScnB-like protein [Pseudogemmobacter sp. W21_MBD1_M6]|uniref:ScnB-like protein n=1 Tax=Pseudogemmobacter sp. W21_MBD1_M6 TaxID=3240271 RepID=UPI003F9820EB